MRLVLFLKTSGQTKGDSEFCVLNGLLEGTRVWLITAVLVCFFPLQNELFCQEHAGHCWFENNLKVSYCDSNVRLIFNLKSRMSKERSHPSTIYCACSTFHANSSSFQMLFKMMCLNVVSVYILCTMLKSPCRAHQILTKFFDHRR